MTSIHPTCFLNCSAGHQFLDDTHAHDLYVAAICGGPTAHDAYLSDPSLRKSKNYRCPCGKALYPYSLPENACKDLLRMLSAIEYSLLKFAATCTSPSQLNSLRDALGQALEEQSWFAYSIPIFQACLNTAWKAGLSGVGFYLLTDLYELFAAKIKLEEPGFLDEDTCNMQFWEGMSEEEVIAHCRHEPLFSWDDVEV